MVCLISILFQPKPENIIWCIALAMLFLIGSHFSAILAFGYGKVPAEAEEFSERLDNNIAYELVSSTRDGESYVLLLRKFGTSNYKAVRTNTNPPEIFTLVSGKPVEIKK